MDLSRSVSASLTSMLTASGRQQAHCARQLNRSVFQNPRQRCIQMAPSLPQSDASLQQQATNLVDHCSTTHHQRSRTGCRDWRSS